jgi:hypothetical protein
MAGTVDLFVNRNNTRGLAAGLIRSATDATPVAFPALVVGDTLYLSLQVVSDTEDGTLETLTSYSIRLGIGTPGARPTGGTFTVGDGSDTTAALAYNISAANLETALNALNTAAGPFSDTVTVSGSAGGPYKVTWDNTGAHASLTITPTALTPESGSTVSELVAGDGSTAEVQSIHLYQQPLVLVTSWTISGTQATASVNLNDYDLYTSVIDAGGSITLTLEIEITDASGRVATLVQRPVIIYADVLPTGAGAQSLNQDTFATQAYVDARTYRIKADSADASPDYIDNKVANSVVVTVGDTIELDGDAASPGGRYYYGTDAAGNKGFQAAVAEMIYLEETYG